MVKMSDNNINPFSSQHIEQYHTIYATTHRYNSLHMILVYYFPTFFAKRYCFFVKYVLY